MQLRISSQLVEVCLVPDELRISGIRNNCQRENRKRPAEVGWPNSTWPNKLVVFQIKRAANLQIILAP